MAYPYMYFVLPRAVRTVHKTNTTVFISLLGTCTFQFDLLISKEGLKGVGITGTLPLCHHFQLKFREVTQVRKDMRWFLGHSCVLETIAFL